MLQTQHRTTIYNRPLFVGHNLSEEEISQKIFSVRGLSPQGGSARITTPRAVSLEEIMEVLDYLRTPLALKRLRREAMTAVEQEHLRVLDELVGLFVERPTPMPPIVRDALKRADQLLRR